ncbi:MAG: response regulator transcription factor [Gammaproteobacteria bacterium]|nr:response regulator transcription factor [Gammaproteobacteria bacterium]
MADMGLTLKCAPRNLEVMASNGHGDTDMIDVQILLQAQSRATEQAVLDYFGRLRLPIARLGPSSSSLRHSPNQGIPILMIENGAWHDGEATLRHLREAWGDGAGLVLFNAPNQMTQRIAAWEQGIDCYLPGPVDPRELQAVVERLSQRLCQLREEASPSAVIEGYWSLDREAMSLVHLASSDELLQTPLTGTEMLLLQALMEQPGEVRSRQMICGLLGPGGDPMDTRRLDCLVSRLRSKVMKQMGCKLPLQSYRNLGYAFNGKVRC